MKIPLIKEVFIFKEQQASINARQRFLLALKNLASKNGNKIPLTHETTNDSWQKIFHDGKIGGHKEDYGIFCFVGHHDRKKWLSGDGVIIQIDLPIKYINSFGDITPDMRFMEDSEEETIQNMFDESPTLKGLEVSVNVGSIPISMWKAAIDSDSGDDIL